MEQKDGIQNHSSKEADFLNQCGYIHKYEFKRIDDWLYKKLPNSLPKFIKVFFRLTEMLCLGVPSEKLRLVKISKLTKSRYDLLLFSKQPIQQS